MKKTLKYIIITLLPFVFFTNNTAIAQQQDTALINTIWQYYAFDTTATYRQIVTTLDTLFAQAGYTDTAEMDTQDSHLPSFATRILR